MGTAERSNGSRPSATAGTLLLAAGLALFVGSGPGGERTRPVTGGRVAVVSIDGLGPEDLEGFGLAGSIGRVGAAVRVAYGLVRQSPPPGTDAVWAEAVTGRFVLLHRQFRVSENRPLWDVARGGGRRPSIHGRISTLSPGSGSEPFVEPIVAEDRGRIAEALAAWRDPSVRLVALRIESVVAERSRGRRMSPPCRALVDHVMKELVLAPGPDGTAVVFSSGSRYVTGGVADPAGLAGEPQGRARGGLGGPDERSEGPPISRDGSRLARPAGEQDAAGAPGIVVMSGRGVGGRRWPGNARIADVTPTALYLLGLASPQDVDGMVLYDLLEPSFLFHNPTL